VRAAEVDTTQAKSKSDRELLETVYSVLVTADPTPLQPDPPPGLIERVANLEKDRTFSGEISDGHLEGTVHNAGTE
jgi:hypothetical protein